MKIQAVCLSEKQQAKSSLPGLPMLLIGFALLLYWFIKTLLSDAFQQPETSHHQPIGGSDTTPVSEAMPVQKIEHSQNQTLIGLKQQETIIRSGDTLSVLFDQYGFGQNTLQHILSADESLLALETLRPGNTLYFRHRVGAQYLEEMELFIHPGHRVIYRRVAHDEFQYENVILDGQWREERISGVIDDAFYLSVQNAGLTEMDAARVTHIFKDKLDFSRAIRKGDQFQVIRSAQFIEGKPTGKTRIISARIQQRKQELTAFLFKDGRYYDQYGKGLSRAFLRTPLLKEYRVSSPFNPKRVHPVTGRVGPHNGTDFATPTGTKVLSTGDGVIIRVGNHPYAGRYVDIQHGGEYKTRYLHLHRVLVSRGDAVKKGQIIALSGNTGRSTGPHLHFEIHIHGKPVDPMKAKIPTAGSIPDADKPAFSNHAKLLIEKLNAPSNPLEHLRHITNSASDKKMTKP